MTCLAVRGERKVRKMLTLMAGMFLGAAALAMAPESVQNKVKEAKNKVLDYLAS